MPNQKSIEYFHANNVSERIKSLLKPVENFADSFGLQPFRIIISSNNNHDISNARHNNNKAFPESWILIFVVRNQITRLDIDDFIEDIRENKKYSAASLSRYRRTFEESINKKNDSGDNWAERQARSGVAILLASARQRNVHVQVDEITEPSLFDDVLPNSNKEYTSKISVQLTWDKKETLSKKNSDRNTAVIEHHI